MAAPTIIIPSTTAPKEPWPELEFFRGDTIRFPFQIVNLATGGAIDITGWTVWWTAKFAVPNPDAQSAWQVSTTTGGVVLVSPTQGQGIATVQPIATVQWPDGPVKLQYDLQTADLTGVVQTVERGVAVVWPDITRTT